MQNQINIKKTKTKTTLTYVTDSGEIIKRDVTIIDKLDEKPSLQELYDIAKNLTLPETVEEWLKQ
jgi:hypothetical protein